jgi:hypothetical protein
MSTHALRLLPASDTGPTYLVERTRFVRPGTAYVVAACVDPALTATLALGAGEPYDQGEMQRDPALRAAMEAWEAGDLSLFERERDLRVAAAGRSLSVIQAMARHPSTLSKLPPSRPALMSADRGVGDR